MFKFLIRSLIRDNGFNFAVSKEFFRFYHQSRSFTSTKQPCIECVALVVAITNHVVDRKANKTQEGV